MTKLARAYLDLTIAMIIVGSSVVVGKIITDAFPLFLASGVRFGIASSFLLIVTRNHEEGLRSIQKRDWIILILMALSGQFAFTLCLLWGLRLTGSAEAGLIISTTPAFMPVSAVVLSYVFLREQFRWSHLVGGVLIVGAIAVMALVPARSRQDSLH